jgi:hypothetical protein
MAKECPFKKNIKCKDRFGYLVDNGNVSAIKSITFGTCSETECMAYDCTTNTCKLLEKGIFLNECSGS